MNRKAHYRIHNCPLPVSILSQPNPVHTPHPTSLRSILMLSSHLRLGLPIGLFPSGFPTKTLCTPLSSPTALHALPISFFFILLPAQYWVRSIDHEVPNYEVFSETTLAFRILGSRRDDTACLLMATSIPRIQSALHFFVNSILIYEGRSQILKLDTSSKGLSLIVTSWVYPAFWSRDMKAYSVSLHLLLNQSTY
jgi:hypothetical protein